MKSMNRQASTYDTFKAWGLLIDRMNSWGEPASVKTAIHITYSKQLKELKSLKEITLFLSDMLNKNVFPDTVIINQIIKKMDYLRQLNYVLDVHAIAVSRGFANAITYNSTIDAIAKSATPDVDRALILFNEARSLGFADAITYNSTISSIAKSAMPDTDRALTMFNEARSLGFANAITYNSIISAIAKSAMPDTDRALTLFNEARSLGFANAITYNSTISAIANSASPDVDRTLILFNEARSLGFADAFTYASTISAIANSASPDVDRALILFNEARSLGFADAITYNSTISSIAKSASPDVDRALILLNEARSLGFADAITYNSTISSIAKSAMPDTDRALTLFNEARSLGFANAITYASTIDAIAKNAAPDERLALSLLDEAIQTFNCLDMTRGEIINLHNLSFGEVYFGLKRRLQTELKNANSAPIHLELIYGQGLHHHASQAVGDHPLKEAVDRVIQEMSVLGVSGKEHQDNPGRFKLIMKTAIQATQSPSSALTQNSMFPNINKTGLNPDAKAFVPKFW